MPPPSPIRNVSDTALWVAFCRAEESERPDVLGDVLDRAGSGRPVFAIAEGLLVDLPKERVEALARALAAREAIRRWLIDLASPRLLAMLRKRWQPLLEAGGTPMIFAPAEGTAFFAPNGWRETDYRSIWVEATRLRRAPRGAAFWNLVAKLMPAKKRREVMRTSGVVLPERAEDARSGR